MITSRLPLLLSCATAGADELALVGRHELSGRIAGVAFTGALGVRGDATYEGERHFADGRVEALAGRASLDEKTLVLTPAGGLVDALRPAGATSRRYARADADRAIRWRFAQGDDEEVLRQPGQAESKWEFLRRALRRPTVLCWFFNDNRGVVDATAGLEV